MRNFRSATRSPGLSRQSAHCSSRTHRCRYSSQRCRLSHAAVQHSCRMRPRQSVSRCPKSSRPLKRHSQRTHRRQSVSRCSEVCRKQSFSRQGIGSASCAPCQTTRRPDCCSLHCPSQHLWQSARCRHRTQNPRCSTHWPESIHSSGLCRRKTRSYGYLSHWQESSHDSKNCSSRRLFRQYSSIHSTDSAWKSTADR